MAIRQRRLDIVIAWMQQHPGVVANVQTKLRSLAGSYGYLRKNIGQLNLTQDEQAVFMGELTKTYKAMRVRIGASAGTIKLMDKTLKATTSEMEKTAKAGGIFNKIFTRMGYRTSWVGFRMAIMGRLIMRSVLAPMQRMTGALANWEKSMETVALALAMQEAGMGETGMSAEELRQTLMDLAEEGPKTQTAMQGLGATWSALALENAPTLNKVIGEMQDALEGVGGAIITAMVDAVGEAVPWLGDFLDLLEPISGILGTFAGWLVLASVAMIGIGTAIYLAKPALLALQLMLNPIVVVLGTLIIMILLWMKYWGRWADYMENVVYPVIDRLPNLAGFKALYELVENLRTIGRAMGWIPPEQKIPEAGWGGQSIERLLEQQRLARQEVDIDVSIDIENLASEIDVDAMVGKLTDEISEALRLRGYPGGVP